MKNFIKKNIDKIYHMSVCFALMCIISYISIFAAVIITLAIGVGKEIYDASKPNNKFDLLDLTADIVGIMLAGLYLTLTGFAS